MATRASIGQRILNYPFTDSLLTSVAYMNPRYDGCKLVSSQKNIFTEGDVSYGKEANIEEKTNTIYEFDWGGGAYPEIPKGGAVHLTKIISLEEYDGDNSDVYINKPSDTNYNEWDFILNRSLNTNDNINLAQYEVNASELPNNNIIKMPVGFTFPVHNPSQTSINNHYYLQSNVGSVQYGSINNKTLTFLATQTSWPLLETDSNGDYNPSATSKTPTEVYNLMNTLLNGGERIFISFLNSLTSIGTQNGGASNLLSLSEIHQIELSGSDLVITLKESSQIIDHALGSDDSGFSDNCGALIWVARKGDFITLEALDEVSTSNNYSGLKNGAFYRKDSIDIIKQKFKPLTQHFGENPQT